MPINWEEMFSIAQQNEQKEYAKQCALAEERKRIEEQAQLIYERILEELPNKAIFSFTSPCPPRLEVFSYIERTETIPGETLAIKARARDLLEKYFDRHGLNPERTFVTRTNSYGDKESVAGLTIDSAKLFERAKMLSCYNGKIPVHLI